MCEEPDVCEDGILAGGQGRTGEDISIERYFSIWTFAVMVVLPVACEPTK